jgi:hypothetical protein
MNQARLRWKVQEVAKARGIDTVKDLSFTIRRQRTGLYKYWDGTVESVSLQMIAALAAGLNVPPGDWFRWEKARNVPEGMAQGWLREETVQPDDDVLVWQVQNIIEQRKLDPDTIMYDAHILPHSFRPILAGTPKMIFLTTLGGLARALTLDIGGLFVWDDGTQPIVAEPPAKTKRTRQGSSGEALQSRRLGHAF